MGVKSYRRGNAVISRAFDREAFAAGHTNINPDSARCVIARPSTWGDKSRARAEDRARRLIVSMRRLGFEISREHLVAAIMEKARCSRAMATKAVDDAMSS